MANNLHTFKYLILDYSFDRDKILIRKLRVIKISKDSFLFSIKQLLLEYFKFYNFEIAIVCSSTVSATLS